MTLEKESALLNAAFSVEINFVNYKQSCDATVNKIVMVVYCKLAFWQ